MLNFSESGHPVFRGSSAFGTRRFEETKGKLSVHFCGDDKTVEVGLRTIISVNQLSIYGAVAGTWDELACRIFGCQEHTKETAAQENPESTVIPTELSTTNKTPRTNDKSARKLHDYERKFGNLPDHLQLIELCSNVGITKTVARRQYFTNLDDAELDKVGGSCREHTLPRDNEASKVKRCIRGNRKIGRALEVAVSHNQGRYGIEIMKRLLIWRWNLFLGDDREWSKQTRDGNDGGAPRGPHRCRRLLLQRLLYHITCVSGSMSNQANTTRAVSKC